MNNVVKIPYRNCRICKVDKIESVDNFRWRKDNNKFRTECIPCAEEKKKQYRENNPQRVKEVARGAYERRKANGKHRDAMLKRNFNITLEDYNNMFNGQNGCCKLCGIHQSEASRSFAVDHCHEYEKNTGEILVRGLLCDDCNLGLGNFQDNIETLELAVKYLKARGEI